MAGKKTWLLGCILVVVTVIIIFVWRRTGAPHRPAGPAPSASSKSDAPANAEEHRTKKRASTNPATRIGDLHQSLTSGSFRAGDLRAFRAAMLASPGNETLAAIREFLVSGRDASTGETFEIGPGGELTNAPTLRVLLLDLAGRIARDRASDDAAAISRMVLETKTTADEWAVALRNIAWDTPEESGFLAARMREMIAHEPWRSAPSAGFREAFDIIVHTRDTGLLPTLGQMAAGVDENLVFTSATTLDRLASAAPLATMETLIAHPAAFADSPFLLADCFAKADLADPSQRSAVEQILSRQNFPQAAKEKLIAGLGIRAEFVSHNLVTPPLAADDDSPRSDPKTTFVDWLARRRFPTLETAIRARLADSE